MLIQTLYEAGDYLEIVLIVNRLNRMKKIQNQVNPGRIKSMINFPLYFPTLKIGCFIYL